MTDDARHLLVVSVVSHRERAYTHHVYKENHNLFKHTVLTLVCLPTVGDTPSMSATNQTVDVEPLTNDCGVLDDMRVHQPRIKDGETVVIQLKRHDGELIPRAATRDNGSLLKPAPNYESKAIMADKAVRGVYDADANVVTDIEVL